MGSVPWSHHAEKEQWEVQFCGLAEELLSDELAFMSELPWLNSKDARAAAELGHFLGSRDAKTLSLLDLIIDAAIGYEAEALGRGYVFGVSEAPGTDSERLNLALDRLQVANCPVAFYVALARGDLVHAFQRSLSMVELGRIRPALLKNLTVWVGKRKVTPNEAGSAVRVLISILQRGNAEAGDVAIDFVAYQIHGSPPEHQYGRLREIFGQTLDDLWLLMESAVAYPGQQAFWFGQVLRAAGQHEPARACQIAADMILSDDYQLRQEGQKVLAELSGRAPEAAMQAIGRKMLDENRNYLFSIDKLPLFNDLPPETVISWLETAGVAGARALARHLRPPTIDQEGKPVVPPLTEFVLSRFEDDEPTFRAFLAGVHSLQVYVGSYAAARQIEGDVAKAFLTSPIKRVRQWAALELSQAEDDEKTHRMMEEETGIG